MARNNTVEQLKELSRWQKIGITLGVLLIFSLIGLCLFRVIFVTFVDNYELGFVYDSVTGKIEMLDRSGWIVRTPIRYGVHHIDLRPIQVSISANSRILNAKLVRFNPNGLQTFVEWHGRSAGDTHSNLEEILKCYAFDRDEGKDCPFLTVLSDVAPSQGGPLSEKDKKGGGK